MWLLRTLPNNVLCHIGIRHGLKGPNACITNHSVGGTLAVIEAMEALRHGEADRAVAVGHDTPIEPQMVLYYHRLGLLAAEALRPFDAAPRRQPVRRRRRRADARDRSLRRRAATRRCSAKCWAAATPAKPKAWSRSATTATASRARSARRSTTRSSRPADVGMIVAHGNGTRQSDASEAAAIRRVFGAATPPVTAFKWAFGHLIAAAGIIDAVLALAALAAPRGARHRDAVPARSRVRRPRRFGRRRRRRAATSR